MPELARAKTLAHEIGHLLLHDPAGRLGEWVTDSRQHRGRAEVEAESTAFMVLTTHGIQSDDYTFPYVATWATGVDGQNPVDVVRQTGARVQHATRDILKALDVEQSGAESAKRELSRTPQPHKLSAPSMPMKPSLDEPNRIDAV